MISSSSSSIALPQYDSPALRIAKAQEKTGSTAVAAGAATEDEEEEANGAAVELARSSSSLKPTCDHTQRRLKPRHIQLIGIGGTIGTALYVQIGQGLLHGGPASLFIAFSFW
ncbi:hypothetical protein L228DRAFT_242885 [Xylona heveae TC161]|uniref:Amino acid permease/ SLC12A domain-containing protein n=1 Tax=Xylona heveae (strain CBS 132557 / TC161) TaxID=1328760 RepID=A0A165JM92_XYLHT|nr:hypothetical protein L228DRAFT_242885 [Xylona heveae TC161]KZF26416.1 hypothetical protein L228DRAFT_242885 [Xylona heveae TC161]